MTPQTDHQLSTYTIDPAHSRLGFAVRHMGFTKVRGRFELFEGAITMDAGDLSTLEAQATAQTESITTNEAKRDEHLRSGDFFEVETYPTLTFRSTGVNEASDHRFTLVGELTIRDVTQTVELEGQFLGEGQDPWGGTRVAFEAGTTINRKDFGLTWNTVLEAGGVLVGEKVEIELELQAVLQTDDDA